ncbi:MAG: hypothetical protein WDM91_01025 [Rhizomicrobium sp.]
MRYWMRIGLLLLGLAVAVLGVLWSLRGFGVLTGHFMSNHMQWGWRGLALVAMGGALSVISRRI